MTHNSPPTGATPPGQEPASSTPSDETLPQGAEMLTGHVYDGIQEYDNPTPAWWTWIFIGTTIFAVVYMFFVLAAGDELSPHGQYRRAYVSNVEKKFGTLGELEPDAATIIEYMDNEQWMAFAQSAFGQAGFTGCHGADGSGLTGPNLTDDAFLHIESVEDIATVIREGAAGGKMPPHETRLHPTEIVLLSSYVATLRGQNIPGRAPEGDPAPPWGTE